MCPASRDRGKTGCPRSRTRALKLSERERSTLAAAGIATLQFLIPWTNRYPRIVVHGQTPDSRPFLSLRDGTFRLGDLLVFENTTWTFHADQHWAIIGPNGCGKSLFADGLRGRLPLVQGRLQYHFRPPAGLSPEECIWELKSQIGWVSPELQVHFDTSLTCFEAVGSGFHDSIGLYEPLTLRQQAAARRWLKRFNLAPVARMPLEALSTGAQRLVLLARALVKKPQLLILDEPCQGLDADHRAKFISILEDLIQGGSLTAIYVTHRKDEIPPSMKRALRLAHGCAWMEALR